MATHKKRQRPAAGIEVAYEDEHFSAVLLYDPLYPDPVLHVYSKPHDDFMFKAINMCLLFWCKRCQVEHILRWEKYFQRVQQDKSTPPYVVLCAQPGETLLMQSDERLPAHLKAYKMYTITGDTIELIANIARLPLTGNSGESG